MSAPLYFYCPSTRTVESAPLRPEDYWSWLTRLLPRDGIRLEVGSKCTWDGPYSWTVQTAIFLRMAGVECQLVSEIPQRGIVFAHSDFWSRHNVASHEQFFVEIKPDRDLKLADPQFIVCQSEFDPILSAERGFSQRATAIGYWPQPSLLPRRSTRGEMVNTAVFMGNPENFLSNVKKLKRELAYRGIAFHMLPRAHWHDYSNADIVIGVRNPVAFTASAQAIVRANTKPPNKLINAWLAGVPAILSSEPALEQMRQNALDFLEANTVSEILDAVDQLILRPGLYRRMIENGVKRGESHSSDSVTQEWIDVIFRVICPLYERRMR